MFDSSLIVQSAISSFNNIAISAPSFFWYGVFMLPLFWLIHKFGAKFGSGLDWTLLNNDKGRLTIFSCVAQGLMILWLVLMHGNYSVLRETTSILPFVIATSLFLLTASVVRKLREINPNIPKKLEKITNNKFLSLISFVLISVLIGFSGFNSWWGFLLQSAAVFSGAVVGRYSVIKKTSPLSFTTFIIFVLTAAVLMQPEFFRFGQLGNLTFIHLLSVFSIIVVSIAIFALRYFKPHNLFRDSFFKKLKLLSSIAVFISVSLFLLTESVLIFLGLSFILLCHFAISVWHSSEKVSDNARKKLWAVLLMLFGFMSVIPVITVCGILYWETLPRVKLIDKLKFLL